MQIFGKFGIDIRLLVGEIINFLIVLWLLKKLIYAPLLSAIRQGETELTKAKKEKMRIEKERIEFEERKKISAIKSRNQAIKIINEAKYIAKEIKSKTAAETELERQNAIKQIKLRLSEAKHE